MKIISKKNSAIFFAFSLSVLFSASAFSVDAETSPSSGNASKNVQSANVSNNGEKTAETVAKEAVGQETPAKAITYIKNELPKITVPAQKRALLSFLGSIQESVSYYDDARASYAAAAAIAAGDVHGMQKKSSQQLVLDAVRCALCAGESETAASYLNSAVRNSKNENIQAQIKLYEQWAALCLAEESQDISEPVSMLQAYLNLPSMKSVRPSVLLTLWYLTGKGEYSDILKKEYPYSAECGIVRGKVQVLPAPFWYFVPRQAVAIPSNPVLSELPPDSSSSEKEIQREQKKAQETKVVSEKKAASAGTSAKTTEKSEKTVKLQLGLFRDKANAEAYAEKVKAKGFDASVKSETRASGTTYYLVIVPENASGTIAPSLRSAGFECYPE